MRVDFNLALQGFEGPVKDAQTKQIVTLKDVCVIVLTAIVPEENPTPTGKQKFDRWMLAKKINDGGSQDVSPEEVALMKKLIGLAYPPDVVGPAYEILNQ